VRSPWVLQLCHSHSGPFLEVARQYAALFRDTPFKVLTVYLTGAPTEEARADSASDKVVFLDYTSKQIRSLKLNAIRSVRKIAASHDTPFSFIIAHRFKPIYIACLATKLPIIGTHHAFGDYNRLQRRWFARLFRERLTLLGVSDAVRDDIRKNLPGWPPERIETLHNRIDVDALRARLLSREDARARLALPQEATVIANAGRLHPDKDQATLLKGFAEALPRLPAETLLVIAGSGALEDNLKALAQKLNIADYVRFLGQIPDARRYFRAFDLFALSSDHEPFGLVLLEAMAADVPILATDCGGAPEVVGDPEQLFPLGASTKLAEKLVDFLTCQEKTRLAAITQRNNCRLRENFTDDIARETFLNLPMIRRLLP